MADPIARHRWFYPKPHLLIVGLLAVECLLWLSNCVDWRHWHKGYAVLVAVASVGVVFSALLLWFFLSLIFHSRFQFSLRSLLVVPLAVAVACSWFAVEMKKAREQKAAVAALAQVGGWTCAQWQVGDSLYPLSKAKPPEPKWLRNLVGDDFFDTVVYVDLSLPSATDAALDSLKDLGQLKYLDISHSHVTDVGLKCLSGLTQLEHLELQLTGVTDTGLENLEGLCQLDYLDIGDNNISDVGLQHLKGLPRLQVLVLGGTQVTDSGLDHLAGLGQLSDLYLGGTRVTDAGLEKLKTLGSLQNLWLGNNRVTDTGVQRLRQVLPNCKIRH